MKKKLLTLVILLVGFVGVANAWQASFVTPCGRGVTTSFPDNWSLDECYAYYHELIDIVCG